MVCATEQPATGPWQANVARHFQRAAMSYADTSALQQASAQDFFACTQARGLVLELGAGHGAIAQLISECTAVSTVLALDISEAMLRQAPIGPKVQRVVGSALAIPLRDQCVDTVMSHFALHWCLSPRAVAAELRRVVRAQGHAQLAIPLAGSLAPLHGDGGDGALLLPLAQWQAAFAQDWQLEASDVKTYTRHFTSARDWLAYLRAMGVTATPQAAPASRRHVRELLAGIEQAAEPAGIPFTFQVWHARLRAV
ncbi:methyltransferase family protein [Paraperlucidibaca baekdonensis]|uniref:Methyltransferase family protein n=1 Tax=Paraperlucidibaca baekdonensis TaxID=748120 RepID=A0A3E0HAD2_9GAMM|nr:methyltransferase family protein [Paraperlucidibaca baekdonensis]